MFRLPLFPLNTVLFPGMPLRLHIFEERYKQMMAVCLEKRQPFGVVLIEEGLEAGGPLAEPHLIGCTAQIMEVEPLDEGQMNVTAVGGERFKILSLDHANPYLAGLVEASPMDNENPQKLLTSGNRLRPWVERYLQILTRAGDMQFDPQQLPGDALSLANLAAYLIQIPLAQKQELLALDDAVEFLDGVAVICRREVALLDAIIERVNTEDVGPFSLN